MWPGHQTTLDQGNPPLTPEPEMSRRLWCTIVNHLSLFPSTASFLSVLFVSSFSTSILYPHVSPFLSSFSSTFPPFPSLNSLSLSPSPHPSFPSLSSTFSLIPFPPLFSSSISHFSFPAIFLSFFSLLFLLDHPRHPFSFSFLNFPTNL